ncbi:MAG: hypothetical protein HY282_15065 [Nitrospirae bacterium]|nr:hypothetical protein [Candidatus Manganitrophaceae bacterium]
MISLAILAVLFTLVYGSFNATYRASEQLEKEADAYRLARLGFYYLSKDLSMIYQAKPVFAPIGQGAPLPPATITATSLFKGEDRTRTIDGTDYPDDSIRFTAVSHGRTMRDAAESDWAVISYHLEEGLLIHEEALSNERVVRNEVGEAVLGIRFRYLDSADRTWVTQWDSDQKKSLPLAVEIELILKGPTREGRRFKTTVEIPLGGKLS